MTKNVPKISPLQRDIRSPQHADSSQARTQFLDCFKSLRQEFDAIQRSARQQEQDLMQDQALVAHTLEDLINAAQGKLVVDHPVSQLCHALLEETRKVSAQWLQAAQRFDKGTSLNDQCKGSFVTYVYGKVNSGKSSLGNFIATGSHKPTQLQVKALESEGLRFVLHDQSDVKTRKKQDLKQGFVVDEQECTSAVQYFILPGQTWVDVPGLHSKNAANGELAAEYLQSADLAVYVMNAESPARESDMPEIKSLLEMGKPLVFVITCSDEMVWDEVDGQRVEQREMYSQQDRQDQNQYLLDTLKRHFGDHPGLRKVHAISVSVRYAEEVGEDSDRLEDSGIPDFLRMMQGVIEQDSVQIKKLTPVNNLAHFASQLILASQTLGQRHSQIRYELQKLQEDVESRYQSMAGQLIQQLNIIISQAMQDYQGDNAAFSRQISDQLNTACGNLLNHQLTEQLNRFEGVVAHALSFDASDDLPDFTHEYQSFSYSDSGKKRAWGGAGGTLAGAAAGAAIAGPVGALVGGFIGGLMGERAGDALGKEHSHQVIVGDNRYQVEEAAYKVFTQRIYQQLEQSYRTPMLQVAEQLTDTLQQFETLLNDFCQRTQPLAEPSLRDSCRAASPRA